MGAFSSQVTEEGSNKISNTHNNVNFLTQKYS